MNAGLLFRMLSISMYATSLMVLSTEITHAQQADYYCDPSAPFLVRLVQALAQIALYVFGVVLSLGLTWIGMKNFFSKPSFEGGADLVEDLMGFFEPFIILAAGLGAAGACLAGAGSALSCDESGHVGTTTGASNRVAESTQVAPPTSITWTHERCLRSIGLLQQTHSSRWDQYVGRDLQRYCARELSDAGYNRQAPASEQSNSAADATYCLNKLSELKSKYGTNWQNGITPELYSRCKPQIESMNASSGQGEQATTDRPGFVGYREVTPLRLSEPERRQHCIGMINFAKRQFGYSWLSHIHPQRKSDCRSEIADVIRADRDSCRFSTGCNLSLLPRIEDIDR